LSERAELIWRTSLLRIEAWRVPAPEELVDADGLSVLGLVAVVERCVFSGCTRGLAAVAGRSCTERACHVFDRFRLPNMPPGRCCRAAVRG
jgi:hypothetical protein